MTYLTLIELAIRKYWKVLLVGLLVILLAGSWWYDRTTQYKLGKKDAEAAAELATSKLNVKLQDVERKAQDDLDKKDKELEDERKKTTVAVSALQLESNGLRQQLQNKQLKLDASVAAGTTSKVDATELTTSWKLLDQCTSSNTELAKTSDEYRDILKEAQNYGQVIETYRESLQK